MTREYHGLRTSEKPMATSIGVLERGLLILTSFTHSNPQQKLHEIATRTGFDRATTSRALKTLIQFGFLIRSADGAYSPGPSNLRLAALFTAQSNILSRLQPPLNRISEYTGQAAAFYARSADERICMARDETKRSIPYFLNVGETIALSNGGSASNVLQAYTEPDFAASASIRETGYYISWGEMHPHMASVAIPVRESVGTFLGAIAVTGFKADLSMDDLKRFAAIAKAEIGAAGFV